MVSAAMPVVVAAILYGSNSIYAQDEAAPGSEAGPGGEPENEASAQDSAADEEILAHGEYLALRVAMCHECHTPRDADGELRGDQLLMGASMPVAPPQFAAHWGLRAPAIAGLPGYTDQEAVRLLTRGITRRGGHARPPMPRFGLTDDDARAVVAYLRSL